MCRAKVNNRTCHFYNGVETAIANPLSRQNAVVDIEDLLKLGSKTRYLWFHLKCFTYPLSLLLLILYTLMFQLESPTHIIKLTFLQLCCYFLFNRKFVMVATMDNVIVSNVLVRCSVSICSCLFGVVSYISKG